MSQVTLKPPTIYIMQPLTNEQIWGIPDWELPVVEEPEDYFDYAKKEVIEQCDPPAAGPGEELD